MNVAYLLAPEVIRKMKAHEHSVSIKEIANSPPSSRAQSIEPVKDQPVEEMMEEKNKTPKSLRFKLTVFFLCLISVVASMDAVIVAACLAAIAKDLSSTSIQSFWVGTSFLLSQTVTIPIYGTTSEIFGRKWTVITGIAVFMVGSILCATAKNVDWLIGARVVQGVGAGGIVQLVQVILSDITTMQERGLYMALSSAAWAVGTNIGVSFMLYSLPFFDSRISHYPRSPSVEQSVLMQAGPGSSGSMCLSASSASSVSFIRSTSNETPLRLPRSSRESTGLDLLSSFLPQLSFWSASHLVGFLHHGLPLKSLHPLSLALLSGDFSSMSKVTLPLNL